MYMCIPVQMWDDDPNTADLAEEDGPLSPRMMLGGNASVTERSPFWFSFIQENLAQCREDTSYAYKYEQGSGMIVLKMLESGSHSTGFLVTIFYFRF